jgi:hypothetical protein
MTVDILTITLPPVRLTIRQRYAFGPDRALVGDDLVRPESWDALRLESEGPFALPPDRAALERLVDGNGPVRERARAVDETLERLEAVSLASYGSGTGLLEAALRRLAPGRALALSEYAPGTVQRLTELFPDASVERIDLLRDPPLPADVHLFHRIDTDLDNAQWRGVFDRFSRCTVIVVAADTLGPRVAFQQLLGRLARGTSESGWVRSRGAFASLWSRTHRATPTRFADCEGWVLKPLRGPGEPGRPG